MEAVLTTKDNTDFESDKNLWREGTTFKDLCNLTKQYIEGQIHFIPAYYGTEVDDETKEIAHYLSALNENGFMTRNSQPGRLETQYKQRACVDGFALQETALRIAKVGLISDLFVAVYRPGKNTDCMLPVTVEDFAPFTWAGSSNFEELESFTEFCSQKAMVALSSAWYVSVIDLVWGRKNHLWDTLAIELCYSVKSHPNLGLDSDV
jgi:hypothetical protein